MRQLIHGTQLGSAADPGKESGRENVTGLGGPDEDDEGQVPLILVPADLELGAAFTDGRSGGRRGTDDMQKEAISALPRPQCELM